MPTGCNPTLFHFAPVEGRSVAASSDARCGLTPLANDLVHSVPKPLLHDKLATAIALTRNRVSEKHPL